MHPHVDDIPVLILLNSLEMGGSQKNAVELADVVRQYGYSPTVMAWNLSDDSNKSILEIAAKRGLEVVQLDRPRRTLAAGKVVAAVAHERRCRLVHSYGWTMFTTFWGPGRWGRLPLVSTIYEMHVYPGPPYRSTFIYGTEYQHLLARRRGPSYLVPPPVDLEHDNPALFRYEASDAVIKLVIVSRLAEEMKAKGIETAIHAMQQLPSSVQLVIAGDGDAATRLRNLGRSTNQVLGREAVVFTGNAVDARPLYAQADIVLGMGGSAARGLAFAKPLVALGDHGWSETFTPASAQVLSANSYWSDEPEPDPERRLVRQLTPLICSRTYREELGRFGQEFIRCRQGLDRMGSNLARIYSDALKNHSRAGWYLDALPIVFLKSREAGRRLVGLDSKVLNLRRSQHRL